MKQVTHIHSWFFLYYVVVAGGQHRKVLELTSSSGLNKSTITYGTILPEGDQEAGWSEPPQQETALRKEREQRHCLAEEKTNKHTPSHDISWSRQTSKVHFCPEE